jgi:hypothetical protein
MIWALVEEYEKIILSLLHILQPPQITSGKHRHKSSDEFTPLPTIRKRRTEEDEAGNNVEEHSSRVNATNEWSKQRCCRRALVVGPFVLLTQLW